MKFSGQKESPDRVLVVTGDIFDSGDDLRRVVDFNEWLGTLPFNEILVIGGNWDQVLFDHELQSDMILTNATYLRDELITIQGISFYGTPWLPAYGREGAFMLPEDSKQLVAKRELFPKKVKIDVLLTHCPPKMILDRTSTGENMGCALLREKLVSMENKPKIHVFGHLHSSFGMIQGKRTLKGITFVNASILSEGYKTVRTPIVVRID